MNAPARPPTSTPGPSRRSTPTSPPPGTVEAWEAVAPVRPDTAHVRAPRFLDLAGELVSAALIIAGGVFAYGFLPLA